MRKTVHITGKNERRILGGSVLEQSETNRQQRGEMKKILRHALLGELTERQRRCVTDYYFNGKKEWEIACELGLNPSTVCRHIASAKRKLRRVTGYYCDSPTG